VDNLIHFNNVLRRKPIFEFFIVIEVLKYFGAVGKGDIATEPYGKIRAASCQAAHIA
jgi:hypothetical protein